jgi:hypothetical protein
MTQERLLKMRYSQLLYGLLLVVGVGSLPAGAQTPDQTSTQQEIQELKRRLAELEARVNAQNAAAQQAPAGPQSNRAAAAQQAQNAATPQVENLIPTPNNGAGVIFGPTGIGVLQGREELLNATQPWQGGGNMISDVTFERTQYQSAPARFEAGTGNIADAVGLGAALDYVTNIGIDAIAAYEHQLLEYATRLLKEIPGLRQIGTAREKASVMSFVLQGYRTEDVGAALNKEGIAVRSGHHCAQPILRHFGVESTVRPSLAFYNTCEDVDRLIAVLIRLSDRRAL